MTRSSAVRLVRLFAGAPVVLACGAAWAQSAPSPPAAAAAYGDDYEVEELIVSPGQPLALRGSVVGDAVPEITLDQREIRALGVGSVDELLAAMEPQLSSGRGRGGGRPVTLVNGVRISSYSEIRDLPTEAIVRMEILPEEVALRYGYRADQRVVNFVLRRRFRALTTELEATAPTEGGRVATEAEANFLRLQGDTRMQLKVEAERETSLLESERSVIRTDGDDPASHTLLPGTDNVSLNAVVARPIREGLSASLNGEFETSNSKSRLGPSGDPSLPLGTLDPLRRLSDVSTAHLGGAMNGAVSGWRWTATANADRSKTRTFTETAFDPLTGAARPGSLSTSTVTSADAEVLFNGTLFKLPAGDVNASITLGADTMDLDAESFRNGVTSDNDLDRQTGRLQVNLDAPLGGDRGGIPGVGSLSVNFNAEVEELSDFGRLEVLGGGLTWSPVDAIRVIASVTDEDGAPTVQQLGNPEIVTPGVRVFDFTRGETVEVTRVEGGNPGLVADNRRVLKIGVTLKPFDKADFMLRADYTRTRLENEISAFPAATSEVEAAFPDRFVRDSSGQLLLVDVRPVNLDRHDQDELRWGFNYSRPLGPQRSAGQQQPGGGGQERPPGDGPRGAGAGGPGMGGGRGFGGFGGRGGGNLQVAVFHTWRLKDEVLIRPGVPELDLLDGDVLGGGAFTPKHQVDVQLGASRNGFGGRLSARWQEGGKLDSADGDLDFSDLTTVNARLFADLGARPAAQRHPWMRGARVSLSVTNLFDERVDVRDPTGATPISYQPDLLDPLGRTLEISFRKIFLPRRPVPPPGARPPS